jgi:hypothetical protein
MALNEAPRTSPPPRETLTGRPEGSLAANSWWPRYRLLHACGSESDRESQSGGSEDSEIASDNSRRLKVAAMTVLAGISYDFGQSIVTKTRVMSMESYTCYFPKGYGRAPGAESMLEPRANEAVMFKDFFAARLQMPPHPIRVDILCKFQVQLHQLTPNTIIHISKFIWAITSCQGRPTTDVFA